jgi:hypothetical protein
MRQLKRFRKVLEAPTCDGTIRLLGRLDRRRFPQLRHDWVDQGYRGAFLDHVKQTFGITLEYEFLPATSEAVIYLAMIQILTRRLANR